jgi:hypothetical protein
VIENRVLERIFVPKRDEGTREWRKLDNEEINDKDCSHKINRVNILRRMRWVGHVACVGDRKVVYSVWWENRKEKNPLQDPGVDERIILKWILKKWDMGLELT